MKKCRVLCVVEHNFNIVPTIEKVQAADHFFSKAYDGDRKRIVSLENLADLIGGKLYMPELVPMCVLCCIITILCFVKLCM